MTALAQLAPWLVLLGGAVLFVAGALLWRRGRRAQRELARAAAQHLGLSHTEIMTVAGHDSTNMKDVVPTVMLFIPSIEGVSHHELENSSDADSVAGVRMLSEVVARLLRGDLG